jgi:hypothetical protein
LKKRVFTVGRALPVLESSNLHDHLSMTLDEMKRNYERQREEEFKAHVCAKHPELPAKS